MRLVYQGSVYFSTLYVILILLGIIGRTSTSIVSGLIEPATVISIFSGTSLSEALS